MRGFSIEMLGFCDLLLWLLLINAYTSHTVRWSTRPSVCVDAINGDRREKVKMSIQYLCKALASGTCKRLA